MCYVCIRVRILLILLALASNVLCVHTVRILRMLLALASNLRYVCTRIRILLILLELASNVLCMHTSTYSPDITGISLQCVTCAYEYVFSKYYWH